ncbi:hypothetical protein [Algibacter sp. PT7-4]|uniref:hypothetical protein n=1 Tax=Algibacter ulvanivorans TaxID=3400999 RepID=UPI003AAF7BD9
MKYGTLPKYLGLHEVKCDEMLFYQYLPIKLKDQTKPIVEERLKCFEELIGNICCDFVGEFGLDRFVNSYVYLTAKRMYQVGGCSFNRKGYHSDGFLTDDINYVWCDKNPTVFNYSPFNLTLDDAVSMNEMEEQANEEAIEIYPENSLLRLDQYNIHKVSENKGLVLRTFVKVSFSADKYDLKGNSKNYLLDYDWEMRDRDIERNIPQRLEEKSVGKK